MGPRTKSHMCGRALFTWKKRRMEKEREREERREESRRERERWNPKKSQGSIGSPSTVKGKKERVKDDRRKGDQTRTCVPMNHA